MHGQIRSSGRTAWLVAVLAFLISGFSATADSVFDIHDDFNDGAYAPEWLTVNPSGSGTFDASSGALVITAPYGPGYGLSIAYYFDSLFTPPGQQQLLTRMSVDSGQGLAGVRYIEGGAMGYGYAFSLLSGQARLVELADTYVQDITPSQAASGTPGSDVWVRLYAYEPGGTGPQGEAVRLLGSCWYVGSAEPPSWMFDSWAGAGVTYDWPDGYALLGAFTSDPDFGGSASFDDVEYKSPEPASVAVLAVGLLGLVGRRRRRSRRPAER